MTENKTSEGLKFLMKLDMSAHSEKMLLQLAKDAIDESHDKRTFIERKGRDLLVNPSSVGLYAAIGKGHAISNANISTNDKLYMVMDSYIKLAKEHNPNVNKDKVLDRFCRAFAERFPLEYEGKVVANKAEQNQTNYYVLRKMQNSQVY